MTAKEKYLAVYSDARAFPLTPDTWVVAHGDDPENPGYAILGPEFDSEEAAWQNAAESLPAESEQEQFSHSIHGFDIEGIGKASCDVCDAPAHWSSRRGSFRCDTHAYAEKVASVEAKEKEPDTAKIPCYEVYDAKDIDCTVFQHERMKDLQEFVYQLLDELEDGESIRIEFKNYTQEQLDEVYDEL